MANVKRTRQLSEEEEGRAEKLSQYVENLRPGDLGVGRPGPGYRGRPSLTARATHSPSIHVRLPEPLYDELSNRADSTGATVSSVVRDVLEASSSQTSLDPDVETVTRALTEIAAEHFVSSATWPTLTEVHRRLGRLLGRDVDVQQALFAVPLQYGQARYGDRASVTVLALHAFAGDIAADLLRTFLGVVNRLVEIDDAASDEAPGRVTGDDLAAAAQDPILIEQLKVLLQQERLLGGGGSSATTWEYDVGDLVRRIGPVDAISDYLYRRDLALQPSPATLVSPMPDLSLARNTLAHSSAIMQAITFPSPAIMNMINPPWLKSMESTLAAASLFAEKLQAIAPPLNDLYRQAELVSQLSPAIDLIQTALATRTAMEDIIQSPAFNLGADVARSLASISDAVASSTSMLRPSLAAFPTLNSNVGDVAAAWRSLVEDEITTGLFKVSPSLLLTGGRGVLGVNMAAGAEARIDLDVDAELLDWESAPSDTRNILIERLQGLHSSLPPKLNGAWDRVVTDGPDAASQAANSLIELLDWSLRYAVGEEDLLAWHAANGRSPEEIDAKGKPTRRLRIHYLCRGDPSGDALVNAMARMVSETFASLQGVKHTAAASDVTVVKRLIPTVEAVLSFVLLR